MGGGQDYKGLADLCFPIGLPNEYVINGILFTEAGSLSKLSDSGPTVFDSNSLRVSAGTGVQWKSPLGLIRVDVGFPIVQEDADKTELQIGRASCRERVCRYGETPLAAVPLNNKIDNLYTEQ